MKGELETPDAAKGLLRRVKKRTMQKNPRYTSLISDIISGLIRSVKVALDAGVKEDKIVIDPGIGFGKTTGHNLEIIKNLMEFKKLGFPILIGTSRKSVIGNILSLMVEERLMGTAATVALSIWNGADIVRVHDVKEARETIELYRAYKGS